ncbi:hypothetical protein [Janibacter sp. GS2]|uniref:hypothetical protein n=1 Tax=Janibacter sp. GS2 TaxID=3442646 RepID=UPI003EB6EC7B
MSTPPPRVRITRTPRQARTEQPRTEHEEITGTSGLGATYVSSLMRAQLQLTLGVLALGVMTLGALPLIFALVPATRSLSIAGLPVAWLLLGLLVYPCVVLTARWYTRASERIETDFSDVVGHR